MRLRIYASVVTWILTATAVVAGMWYGTQRDVLEIFTVVMMFTPMSGLAVMALTEPKEQELPGEDLKDRRRSFHIYTLAEEEWHERKIS